MAKSEIDDIFASKGKTWVGPLASTSSTTKSSQKDKKRKRKNGSDEKDSAIAEIPEKVPETIIDSSASMRIAKRVKISKSNEKAGTVRETKSGNAKKEEDNFKDSRGIGPRRKTEEGWSIYKADELGIKDDDEGGGEPYLTLLLPAQIHLCYRYTTLPL
ncbi:hypothetical protein EV368DRAFT_67955 [Lentinula lateritia]|uniref:Uncharacterized protein n=1 Tax=Lentinula aff. lateritia TaxID=2804960 RepID=A0ACC1TKV4_9AGAR|nr:hypothetical protein F5876DRAFT_51895 [Lentinula aff. lateritia]KAJ3848805.1 hypothetical protein EV368DRAFT_67955 [Lentinula lateritia]